MLELIRRLEAATAPSAELDVAIFCAIRPWPDMVSARPSKVIGKVTARYGNGGTGTFNAPDYTSCLNAAVRSIPAGWVRAVDATAPAQGIHVQLFNDAAGHQQSGTHQNECIATMIAVLRALWIEQAQAQSQQVAS